MSRCSSFDLKPFDHSDSNEAWFLAAVSLSRNSLLKYCKFYCICAASARFLAGTRVGFARRGLISTELPACSCGVSWDECKTNLLTGQLTMRLTGLNGGHVVTSEVTVSNRADKNLDLHEYWKHMGAISYVRFRPGFTKPGLNSCETMV